MSTLEINVWVWCSVDTFQTHPSCRTTTSSQHARPSGVLRSRSDGLERAAWRPPRPVAQCRHFQEEAEDASVSECTWTRSVLEALSNALYKFKTYLPTQWLPAIPIQLRLVITCDLQMSELLLLLLQQLLLLLLLLLQTAADWTIFIL